MGVSVAIEDSDIESLDDIASEISKGKYRRKFKQVAVEQVIYRLTDEKRSPDGSSWPPWSEKYERRNRSKNPNRSMLVREGYLKDSIRGQLFRGNEIHIGSDLFYAEYHQYGTENIPQREFLGLSDDNMDDLNDELIGIFKRSIRKMKRSKGAAK